MPRPNAMGRPKPKIEDPMGKLKRLFCYIFKNYGLHCVFVLVCIIISSLSVCTYLYCCKCICKCTGNYVYTIVDR